MLSICSTVKNRSLVPVDGGVLRLFPNCVKSIVAARSAVKQLELIVADWQSDDWPLPTWLEQAAASIPHRMITLQGGFNRGRGRNRSAEAARGNKLFFLDADCTIDASVLAAADHYVDCGMAYFPIVYSYKSPAHTIGEWRHAGYGNCAVSREVFQRAGGWPEYAGWGKEDDDFFHRISSLVPVVRQETPGFYHQWHPENVLWKDRYTEHFPWLLEESERRGAVLSELQRIIDDAGALILVDETRFGDNALPEHAIWPFIDDHGQYGGPPPDDAVAIQELERMRKKGARFIAFAWMSFWWLDFYADFARHLTTNYGRKLMTPDVVVYDLRERVS